MSQSVNRGPQTRSVASKRARDVVDTLRELCIVFRAESGIACRIELDVTRVCCDGPVGDLVSRRVSALLQQVSKRARARLVTLSLATQSDGSVLVRVDVDEPFATQAEEISVTARTSIASLDQRLLALGIHAEIASDPPSTRLTLPAALVSVD